MGKNVTKNHKSRKKKAQQSYLRMGVLLALVAVGIGTMLGMAVLNRGARPNRDMQWYLQEGAVEVAAPPMGEGYDSDGPGVYAADVLNQEEDAFALADVSVAMPAQQDTPVIPEDNGVGDPAGNEAPGDAPVVPEDDGEPSDGGDVFVVPEGDGEPSDDGGDVFAIPEADAPVLPPVEETAVPEVTGNPEGEDAASEPDEDDSGIVKLTITAAGDCTLGGEIGARGQKYFTKCASEYGLDYFFNNVRYIFENDDLTIVNLEGPLTTSTKGKKHGFVFKGDPEYVKILTGSSVELCNVANNHTLDYGKAGLKETAEVLDAAGVGYCGYTKVYYSEIKGVRVGALGFTWWEHDAKEIAEAVSAARPNCDLLIVNIHWGIEGDHRYHHKQGTLGRVAIDAGADLVIGTHPHVYQGIEKYKGKYIVYSLGNFCFAGNANPADKRCLIFQQQFSFTPGMGIAQAGIVDEGINIIPCTVSSVNSRNNFQPTVMGAEAGADLLKKIAAVSTNFKMSDIRWMRDNYLLANGLIKPKEDATAPAGEGTLDMGADVEPEPDEPEMAETDELAEAEELGDADAMDDAELYGGDWSEDDGGNDVASDWPLNTEIPEGAEGV
ncbi:MAG: CapA family protein [Clostridia bacterium]|nr:CapA family protein [Clostridia bacterium]